MNERSPGIISAQNFSMQRLLNTKMEGGVDFREMKVHCKFFEDVYFDENRLADLLVLKAKIKAGIWDDIGTRINDSYRTT